MEIINDDSYFWVNKQSLSITQLNKNKYFSKIEKRKRKKGYKIKTNIEINSNMSAILDECHLYIYKMRMSRRSVYMTST